ncbi:MAG: hypothetical protein ACXIVQ_01295 [Acidimicrobiales bacterium]
MRHRLIGQIASAGFASGDRLVIGRWHRSPIGPFADVMWGRPDGERVLLSAGHRSERFITAVYSFDRTEVVALTVAGDDRFVRITAGPLEIEMTAGAGWRIPGPRPAWFTRLVEGPVARAAMGVHTYGVSPTGVREWYQADLWRPVRFARARLGGVDLGPMGPVDPPVSVGFTDPPRRPSIVSVRPLLHDPSGRLDAVLADLG